LSNVSCNRSEEETRREGREGQETRSQDGGAQGTPAGEEPQAGGENGQDRQTCACAPACRKIRAQTGIQTGAYAGRQACAAATAYRKIRTQAGFKPGASAGRQGRVAEVEGALRRHGRIRSHAGTRVPVYEQRAARFLP
jgi:hypothetical protein